MKTNTYENLKLTTQELDMTLRTYLNSPTNGGSLAFSETELNDSINGKLKDVLNKVEMDDRDEFLNEFIEKFQKYDMSNKELYDYLDNIKEQYNNLYLNNNIDKKELKIKQKIIKRMMSIVKNCHNSYLGQQKNYNNMDTVVER